MNHDLVTRLVVGDITVTLGVPVRASQQAGEGAPLHLDQGRLVDSRPGMARLITGALFAPSTPSTPASAAQDKPKLLAGWRRKLSAWKPSIGTPRVAVAASAMAVAIGAATLGAYQWTQPIAPKVATAPPATSLPIVPAAAADLSAVKVVATAYQPEQPAAAPASEPVAPLPISMPTATAASPENKAPAVALPAASPQKQVATAAAQIPAPAPTAKKEPERHSAVVMDEPASKPSQAQSAVAKPGAANIVATGKPLPSSPTPWPVKEPVTAPRAPGLIALTPDGKFAVFTNPKTRLPEQFKVGDQLPSGDVIRTIDYKDGRVLTSAKEYHLD